MSYQNFKHKWGQNFLKNTPHILNFVGQLQLDPTDKLLEIGPGDGRISEYLIPNVKKTIAIEVDQELVDLLRFKFQQFIDSDQLVVLADDILDLDESKISSWEVGKICGALPYNISKLIIEKYLTFNWLSIERAVFILQKEVSQKYAATGGKGSLLNHIYSLWYDIYFIDAIEKSKFLPQPKVDSGTILFVAKKKEVLKIEEAKDYIKFCKNAFRNPRKKLIKNLSNIYTNIDWLEIWDIVGLNELDRVEQLSKSELLKLFQHFSNFKKRDEADL